MGYFMRRLWKSMAVLAVVVLVLPAALALAQSTQPADTAPELAIWTSYPSQVVGIGETVNLTLKLRVKTTPQIVSLEMGEVAQDWTATFRGGGRTVGSAYVETETDTTVELRLEPPAGAPSGTYRFLVLAQGEGVEARLPIELTIKEKLPPRLSLSVDMPLKSGTRSTTFSYSATLKNEGDEDLSVNLVSRAPSGFTVTFKLSGQDVNNVDLPANQSKSLTVEARPFGDLSAGDYPVQVEAQAGEVQAALSLTARITGESTLSITTPDGRLSGEANAGKATTLKVLVSNTGSAPARNVKLSSTEPSDWTVAIEPKEIPEIGANRQVEVTLNVEPPEQAVAGDYMTTLRASADQSQTKSADFRITVRTSTLWGVVGIALIAVAVGVVGLAVLRFGRR